MPRVHFPDVRPGRTKGLCRGRPEERRRIKPWGRTRLACGDCANSAFIRQRLASKSCARAPCAPRPKSASDQRNGLSCSLFPFAQGDYSETGGRLMNGLELLREDHQKVQTLFDQVKATENERQHKQLFKKIKTELDTHTYI